MRLAILAAYTWPVKVRQLRNIIERLVATTFEDDNNNRSRPPCFTASLLSEMATQLPIIFRENDSLDDFLDRGC
jgi:DNA-binding NtrC family response regulator